MTGLRSFFLKDSIFLYAHDWLSYESYFWLTFYWTTLYELFELTFLVDESENSRQSFRSETLQETRLVSIARKLLMNCLLRICGSMVAHYAQFLTTAHFRHFERNFRRDYNKFGLYHKTLLMKATEKKWLEAFEMSVYRKMMRISWTEHRTNQSILDELTPSRRFLPNIQRRKLKYFGHIVRAENLFILRNLPTWSHQWKQI